MWKGERPRKCHFKHKIFKIVTKMASRVKFDIKLEFFEYKIDFFTKRTLLIICHIDSRFIKNNSTFSAPRSLEKRYLQKKLFKCVSLTIQTALLRMPMDRLILVPQPSRLQKCWMQPHKMLRATKVSKLESLTPKNQDF